jgi:CrcB protein
MNTTLYIAVGGAIGSMARYWVAIGVTRLAGPSFPWGTILINISGSFVIGLFAAVTAAGTGRLPVAPDLRAFVMVGICGGFTTFSSFSLQTLDLMRDGRTIQALANVSLSVLLCLAAVASGHYSGASLSLPTSAATQHQGN